jgi:hypothetical protein
MNERHRQHLIRLGLLRPFEPGAPTPHRWVDAPTLRIRSGERSIFEAEAKSGGLRDDLMAHEKVWRS